MAVQPDNKRPAQDWRFAVAIGIAIGVGISISRGITQALKPSVGELGAFILGVLGAAAGGALAALLAYWLLHRSTTGR